MQYLTLDNLCAMTGISPVNLKRWRRAGLIPPPDCQTRGYSWSQYIRISHILLLTSRGDTLHEIHTLINYPARYQPSGWEYRQEEIIYLLHSGSERQLLKKLRCMAAEYSSEDLVNQLLMPVQLWLENDTAGDAAQRRNRFCRAVMGLAKMMTRQVARQKHIPLFLEAVSVRDKLEIWLECIRLAGHGFCVEAVPEPTDVPATPQHRYEHHLLWCGVGISPAMMRYYQTRLEAGDPIMLCGPDKTELTQQARR